MTIGEHALRFAGKKVEDWDPDKGIQNPQDVIYRIALDWNEEEGGAKWTDTFAAFLDDPNSAQVPGLVIGHWGYAAENDPSEVVQALVASRERLPNLRAIFLGDITYEECEISWMMQTDVSSLFTAFPQLEQFRVRGGNGLSLGRLNHEHLTHLIIETGGLPSRVLEEVCNARLPNLQHLELWLGAEEYGWEGELDDLQPILEGNLFPKLTYLGLRDSEIADEIAAALVTAPVMEKIEVLDLSLGTLTDEGMKALLTCPHLLRLKKLDIHHHYLSDGMVERLTGALPERSEIQQRKKKGAEEALSEVSAEKLPPLPIEVDASDPQDPDEDYRYVAVGE